MIRVQPNGRERRYDEFLDAGRPELEVRRAQWRTFQQALNAILATGKP